MANNYVKNLKTSFEYLIKDTVDDYTPNIQRTSKNMRQSIKTNKRKFAKATSSMNVIKRQMERSRIVKESSRLTKDLFDGIKSGNVYSGQEDFDSFSMDYDSDLTGYSDVYSDDSSTVEEVDKNAGLSLTQKVQKANTAKASMTDARAANASINSAQALAESNAATAKTLHVDKKVTDSYYYGMMNTHLSNIEKSVGNTIQFLNDIQRQFIDETLKYYKDNMSVLNELKEVTVSYYTQDEEEMGGKSKEDTRSFLRMIMDGDIIKGAKKLGSQSIGAFMGPQGQMAFNMLRNQLPTMLQMMDGGDIMKAGFQNVMNEYLGFDIISTMDDVVGSMDKVRADMLDKMSLSDNPMVSQLGHALRDRERVDKRVKTGGYKKGAIPFDGVTKKAIVDVIPTYLRKIYSELSGQKEMIFDYESGKYKTADDIQREFYESRPDMEMEYGKISRLIERNIDSNVAKSIDSSSLEKVVKKFSTKLLSKDYNISDLAVMDYSQFKDITGISDEEVSRVEFNLIKSSIMEAKTSQNEFDRQQYKEIINSMDEYSSDMNEFYTEANRNPMMTGLTALSDGSQNFQASSLDEDERYKSLRDYDPEDDLEDKTIKHSGLIEEELTAAQKQRMMERLESRNSLDYMASSVIGAKDHQVLQRLGISDLEEMKDLDKYDMYSLENVLSESGARPWKKDAMNKAKEVTNKIGSIDQRSVKDTINDMGARINDISSEDTEEAFTSLMDAAMPAIGGGIAGSAFGPIGIAAGAIGAGMLSQSERIKANIFGEENKNKSFTRNIGETFLGKERTDRIANSIEEGFNAFKQSVVYPAAKWVSSVFGGIFSFFGDIFNPQRDQLSQPQTPQDLTDQEMIENQQGQYGQGIGGVEPAGYVIEARRRVASYRPPSRNGTYGRGILDSRPKKPGDRPDSPPNKFGKGVYFFSQTDNEYKDLSFADSSVSESGCGLMSAAMAVSNILDNEISPRDLMDISKKYKVEKDGISFGFFKEVASRFNIPFSMYEKGNISTKALENTIDSGHMVVSLYEDNSGSLHYILVRKGGGDFFFVDDPIRGKGIRKAKELIYAKSKAFMVFYNEADSKSREDDSNIQRIPDVEVQSDSLTAQAIKDGQANVGSAQTNQVKVNRSSSSKVQSDVSSTVVNIDDSQSRRIIDELINIREDGLNGVAWNAEKIKRILVREYGDLDMGENAIATNRLTRFSGYISQRLDDMLDLVKLPFQKVGEAFGDLGRWFMELQPVQKLRSLVNWIGDGIVNFKDFVKETIPMLAREGKELLYEIIDTGGEIVKEGFEAAKYITSEAIDVAERLTIAGIDLAKDIGQNIGPALHAAMEKTVELTGDMIEGGKTVVKDLYSATKTLGGWLGENLMNLGGSAMDLIGGGFDALTTKLGIKKVQNSTIITDIKDTAIQSLIDAQKLREVYVTGGHLDTVGKIVNNNSVINRISDRFSGGSDVDSVSGGGPGSLLGRAKEYGSRALSGAKRIGSAALNTVKYPATFYNRAMRSDMDLYNIDHVSQDSSIYDDTYISGYEFDDIGCGPAVLKMLLQSEGREVPISKLSRLAEPYTDMNGVSLKYIINTLKNYGIGGSVISNNIPETIEQAPIGKKFVLHTNPRFSSGHYILAIRDNAGVKIFDPLDSDPKIVGVKNPLITRASVAFIVESARANTVDQKTLKRQNSTVSKLVTEAKGEVYDMIKGSGPDGKAEKSMNDNYKENYVSRSLTPDMRANNRTLSSNKYDGLTLPMQQLSYVEIIKDVLLDWYQHGIYMVGDVEQKDYLEQIAAQDNEASDIQKETAKATKRMSENMGLLNEGIKKMVDQTDFGMTLSTFAQSKFFEKLLPNYQAFRNQWVWVAGGDLDSVDEIGTIGSIETKEEGGLFNSIGNLVDTIKSTTISKAREAGSNFMSNRFGVVGDWIGNKLSEDVKKTQEKKGGMTVDIATENQKPIPVDIAGIRESEPMYVQVVNDSLNTHVLGGILDGVGVVGSISAEDFAEAEADAQSYYESTSDSDSYSGVGFDDFTDEGRAQHEQETEYENEAQQTSELVKISGLLAAPEDKRGTEGKSSGGMFDSMKSTISKVASYFGMGAGGAASGGLFSSLFGGSAGATAGATGGGLLGTLSTVATAIAPIAGGLMGIADMFRGWGNAEEWFEGSNEDVGFLEKLNSARGALLGGAGDGMSNIIFNALKWGMIAMPFGSIVPVGGNLAAFGIGSVIGGGLGAIGGERIANALNTVSDATVGLAHHITDNLIGDTEEGEERDLGSLFKRWYNMDGIRGAMIGGIAGTLVTPGIGTVLGAGLGAFGPKRIVDTLMSPIETMKKAGSWLKDKLSFFMPQKAHAAELPEGVDLENYDESQMDLDSDSETKGLVKGASLGYKIAGGFGSVIGAGLGAAKSGIVKSVSFVGDKLGEAGGWLKDKFTGIKDSVKDKAVSTWDSFKNISGVEGAIMGTIMGLPFSPVGPVLGAAIGAIGPAKVLDKILNPIDTLTDAGEYVSNKFSNIKEYASDKYDSAKSAFINGVNKLPFIDISEDEGISEIGTDDMSFTESLKSYVTDKFTGLKQYANEKYDNVKQSMIDKLNVIPFVDISEGESISEAGIDEEPFHVSMKNYVAGIFEGIKQYSVEQYESIKSSMVNKLNKIPFVNIDGEGNIIEEDEVDKKVDTIKNIPSIINEEFNNIIGDIKNTITSIPGMITDFLKEKVQSMLPDFPDLPDIDLSPGSIIDKGKDTVGNIWNKGMNLFNNDDDTDVDTTSSASSSEDKGSMLNPLNWFSGNGPGNNHVYQGASEYSNIDINGRSFSDAGCGPAAVKTALSNTGINLPTRMLAKKAASYSTGRGIGFSFIEDVMNSNNVNGQTVDRNIPQVVRRLNNGDQMVLLTKNKSGGGHYVTVSKENGNLYLHDPLKRGPEKISYNHSSIQNATRGYYLSPEAGMGSQSNTTLRNIKDVDIDPVTGFDRDTVVSREEVIASNDLQRMREIRNKIDKIETVKEEIVEYRKASSNIDTDELQDVVSMMIENNNAGVEDRLDSLISQVESLTQAMVTVGSVLTSGMEDNGTAGGDEDTEHGNRQARNRIQNLLNQIGRSSGGDPRYNDKFLREIMTISQGMG